MSGKLGLNPLSTPTLHVRPFETFPSEGPMSVADSLGGPWGDEGGFGLCADPWDEDFLQIDDDPNDEDYDDEAERRPAYRKPSKQQLVSSFLVLLQSFLFTLHSSLSFRLCLAR